VIGAIGLREEMRIELAVSSLREVVNAAALSFTLTKVPLLYDSGG